VGAMAPSFHVASPWWCEAVSLFSSSFERGAGGASQSELLSFTGRLRHFVTTMAPSATACRSDRLTAACRCRGAPPLRLRAYQPMPARPPGRSWAL
jgi:hypothetical protein